MIAGLPDFFVSIRAEWEKVKRFHDEWQGRQHSILYRRYKEHIERGKIKRIQRYNQQWKEFLQNEL